MKYLIKSVIVFCVAIQVISCSVQDENSQTKVSKATESITISGVVKTIENGKDGYTATLNTATDGDYAALFSIVNLGGPKNFRRIASGDKATISGKPWMLNDEKQLKVEKVIEVVKGVSTGSTRTKLLISETSFRGISVGDKISSHGDYIERAMMGTGEGTFEIYRIKDFNNNPAGYLLPDPNNESLVGNIVVESPMAETKEGVKVGSTFADLNKKLPAIEVHGSEIEGRTYASHNNLSYRLKVANFTYEVDAKKIPPTTSIMEIVINRIVNN